MKLKITNVRLAFPQLFEAKTVNGEGKPAFSAALLLTLKDAQIKMIDDGIDAVAREKWGAKADAILKSLRAGDKTALHDGDLKAQYSGFEGMKYVSTRSTTRPLVIDRDKSPLTEQDGKPYAGCYVNATVQLWAQDNNFGKRVNASLLGIQFRGDGDAFAGGAIGDADDFESLESGSDADDLA